jgi:hypothetical protein
MNLDVFARILNEVGQHFGTTLTPDANNSCLIWMRDAIQIQLELDRSQSYLIVGGNLGELLPGKFRELFLKEALRANGAPYPRIGTFAYSHRKSALLLFERFSLQTLNTTTLIEYLPAFIDKAILWKDAIQSGQPPSIQYNVQKDTKTGMFGLKAP